MDDTISPTVDLCHICERIRVYIGRLCHDSFT
jgi:hypothetical protein